MTESPEHFFNNSPIDTRQLSVKLRFVEFAIAKATKDAMRTATPLGRIPINDSGETVSSVVGEFLAQVECLSLQRNTFRLSDILYDWKESFVEYAVKFLQAKQNACKKMKRTEAGATFERIAETFRHSVQETEKAVQTIIRDPDTGDKHKERAIVGPCFVLAQPAADLRSTIEDALIDEEAATQAMFDGNNAPRNNTPNKKHAEDYRKYPQDKEALDLLNAAQKRLARLRKSNPKATHREAVKSILEEPDGAETKGDRQKRLTFTTRAWYGQIKNGQRENAARLSPERMNAPERERAWNEIYKTFGKYLSCYMKHPPAK